MDPVSLAIISGILGGAAGGVAGETTGEVVRAYKNLRTMLMEKYGKDSILFRSLLSLEEKPESKNKQEGVAEDVLDCGADKDTEMIQAAEALLAEIKKQPDGREKVQNIVKQLVIGNGNIVAGVGDVNIKI